MRYFRLLLLLFILAPRILEGVEGGPLFMTNTGLALLPTQGLQQLQVVLTHGTDCPTNVITARQGNICRDLDDGKMWYCNTTLCTLAAHWINLAIPSIAIHPALSNPNSIVVTDRYMGIQCSVDQCDLTGALQIEPGTACNQEVTFFGSDITGVKTVKLDNGTGIRLPGNTGSIIVGRLDSTPTFRYACDIAVWEQIAGFSLQGLFNDNNTVIVGACGTSSALKLTDSAGTSYGELCIESGIFKVKATCSGGACDSIRNIVTGKSDSLTINDGACDSTAATGVQTFSGVCKPRGSIYIPAESLFMQGCTLSTDVAVVAGGLNGAYIVCGANNAHGYHRDIEMPDSWDGGPITVQLAVLNVNAAPASTHEMDFSSDCGGATPVAYPATISTTGEQAAAFNFAAGGSCGGSACGQNFRVTVTTAAITPNGTCTGSSRLLRLQGQIDAAGTGATQVGDVRHLGLKVEYIKNSRSD